MCHLLRIKAKPTKPTKPLSYVKLLHLFVWFRGLIGSSEWSSSCIVSVAFSHFCLLVIRHAAFRADRNFFSCDVVTPHRRNVVTIIKATDDEGTD